MLGTEIDYWYVAVFVVSAIIIAKIAISSISTFKFMNERELVERLFNEGEQLEVEGQTIERVIWEIEGDYFKKDDELLSIEDFVAKRIKENEIAQQKEAIRRKAKSKARFIEFRAAILDYLKLKIKSLFGFKKTPKSDEYYKIPDEELEVINVITTTLKSELGNNIKSQDTINKVVESLKTTPNEYYKCPVEYHKISDKSKPINAAIFTNKEIIDNLMKTPKSDEYYKIPDEELEVINVITTTLKSELENGIKPLDMNKVVEAFETKKENPFELTNEKVVKLNKLAIENQIVWSVPLNLDEITEFDKLDSLIESESTLKETNASNNENVPTNKFESSDEALRALISSLKCNPKYSDLVLKIENEIESSIKPQLNDESEIEHEDRQIIELAEFIETIEDRENEVAHEEKESKEKLKSWEIEQDNFEEKIAQNTNLKDKEIQVKKSKAKKSNYLGIFKGILKIIWKVLKLIWKATSVFRIIGSAISKAYKKACLRLYKKIRKRMYQKAKEEPETRIVYK